MPLHPSETEWRSEFRSRDPNSYPGYRAKIDLLRDRPAVRTGIASGPGDVRYVYIEFDFNAGDLGGSLGAEEGLMIAKAFDKAREMRLGVVATQDSGGARMEEGMSALTQMPLVVESVRLHRDAGLLSVSIFDQAYGGVFIALGTQTSLRIAAPANRLGYAGARPGKVAGKPHDGTSHTAETALKAGLIDAIVPMGQQAEWIEAALGFRHSPLTPRRLPFLPVNRPTTPMELVINTRDPRRPSGIDYAALLSTSWTPLGGSDPTVRAGLAEIDGERAVVVANDRFADDGLTKVAGFRLARRAITLAQQMGVPLLTFVDMPGADPSSASENAGIASEIGKTMSLMGSLQVPTVSVVVGEGGSGGALALANAKTLYLLRDVSFFSVISPEAAAAIKSSTVSGPEEMVKLLGIEQSHQLEQGIVDGIVEDDIDMIGRAVMKGIENPGNAITRFSRSTMRSLERVPTDDNSLQVGA